ncbi:aspartate carbamoyltransferase [Candidatus Roizmanbacteria bacterium RIFCSPHIGHO2_12_FULL_44_10]|uniref:Aspartate carbamoyltransferase n=1 Tax=Candidatus Roizmanbacteria bacterium RIFCSPHIGHO2_12_FULL_44_10 TaxID=1802054 RepID=A0A1F7I7N0_9BACT|nr:MAG: aspartate carbamoyltransferase [Candidatus Roizmanbacteria bacterium RIFCSPHIGHO2_12_FULL_44_10]
MAKTNPFFNKSYISIDQVSSKSDIEYLFKVADKMKNVVEKNKKYSPLQGKTVAVLFYQPSTRTFTSFVSAAQRLGADVIAINEMTSFSSAVKGETLEDTIKSIHQTTAASAIVLRHPEDNSSELAAAASDVPIINGGSGKKEHPTQALLDLYTIYEKFRRFDNLHVMMVGDLLNGRTIKSLAKLLVKMGKKNKITFVSPKELKAPKELIKELKEQAEVEQKTAFGQSLKDVDVVYMTRVQKEWFEKAGKMDEYERLKLKFIMDQETARQMNKNAIILHPLPRVGEILQEVDADPRAYYFRQMRSGLYTRMALLHSILLP